MKKFGIYSLLLAALVFAGCSQKEYDAEQDVDGYTATATTTTDSGELATDNMTTTDLSDNKTLTVNGQDISVDNIYFEFDKYNLTADNQSKVVSNASKLSSLTADSSIKVIGNTDEWGSDEYNYALGLKRANAVKDALVSNGLKANISLVSLGESNPVCTEKTKECWAKNRRVEHELEK